MNNITDPMVLAYIDCALWSSVDNETPLDKDYDITDIDPDTLATMEKDCQDFLQYSFSEETAEFLDSIDSESIGHDFWLTRNRHGAGFWDRGYPVSIGTELTEAAHVYGTFDLYVGDDNMVYGG